MTRALVITHKTLQVLAIYLLVYHFHVLLIVKWNIYKRQIVYDFLGSGSVVNVSKSQQSDCSLLREVANLDEGKVSCNRWTFGILSENHIINLRMDPFGFPSCEDTRILK